MPCRDYSEADIQRGRASTAEQRADALKETCDELTAMLCHMAGQLSDGNYDAALTPQIREWYINHRAADIRNLENMFHDVDLTDLTKTEFDAIDSILNKYLQ